MAMGGFLVGINSGDYYTATHTNSYNLLISFFSHGLFTIGAGGLVGLQCLKYSVMPTISKESAQ